MLLSTMPALDREKYFFHYTTREAAFEHIIRSNKLRFSRYLDMRDPLENKHWSFIAGSSGDDEEAETDAYWRFRALAIQVQRAARLLSLTVDEPRGEDPFNRGWARARMWEQYAENHAGVCLVFSRVGLEHEIPASLKKQELNHPYFKPVIYSEGRISKPFLQLDDLAGRVSPEVVSDYIERNHEELFFSKMNDWETEHEFRFVVTAEDEDSSVFVDFGSALQAVIVGEKFPRWARPGAIDAADFAGAEPLRLDWSMGAPALARLRPARNRKAEILEHIRDGRSDLFSGPGPPAAPSVD